MAEETPQPITPAPTPEPKPTPEAEPALKRGKAPGKWFRRIPREILFSPGGMVLVFFAGIIEIIDLIPLPGVDSLTWELILEGIFLIFLAKIAKYPLQGMIIPFVIERIPGISDVLPTWLIRLVA